jgi:hypothetical protein
MALRPEAPEFRPGALKQLTTGDLLIQKLADGIISPLPLLPRSGTVCRDIQTDTDSLLKLGTLCQELLPSGIFCPWCTARIQCAFHLPNFGSLVSWEKDDTGSNGNATNVERTILHLPQSCKPSTELSSPNEQCIVLRENQGKETMQKNGELGAAKWLNDALLSMQVVDAETVTTGFSCSEDSYANSEASETSTAIENSSALREEQLSGSSVVWARGGAWGIASRNRGLQ